MVKDSAVNTVKNFFCRCSYWKLSRWCFATECSWWQIETLHTISAIPSKAKHLLPYGHRSPWPHAMNKSAAKDKKASTLGEVKEFYTLKHNIMILLTCCRWMKPKQQKEIMCTYNYYFDMYNYWKHWWKTWQGTWNLDSQETHTHTWQWQHAVQYTDFH